MQGVNVLFVMVPGQGGVEENSWIRYFEGEQCQPMTLSAKLADFPGLLEAPVELRRTSVDRMQAQAKQINAQACAHSVARTPKHRRRMHAYMRSSMLAEVIA